MNETELKYFFYNLQNANAPIEIQWNATNEIKKTYFNASKHTVLLIHGFGDYGNGTMVEIIKNQIVAAKRDVNIIGIDWSPLWIYYNDREILNELKMAGWYCSVFFKTLKNSFNLDFTKLTVAAHSIGGSIAAYLGFYLFGEIQYMVGLDTNGINKSHAQYITVSFRSRFL